MAGQTILKGRQEKTQRQARNDSQAVTERLKGKQENTQRQASNDANVGEKKCQRRQDWTKRQSDNKRIKDRLAKLN